MKVLVTGAAGFIGMHVAERLLARGDRVVGLDNLNAYYDPTLKDERLARLTRHAGFSFDKLDLADREGMAALLARRGVSVLSLEIQPELAALARANLQRAGVHNAEVRVADIRFAQEKGLFATTNAAAVNLGVDPDYLGIPFQAEPRSDLARLCCTDAEDQISQRVGAEGAGHPRRHTLRAGDEFNRRLARLHACSEHAAG
mgnify:CR=1 FL=1